MRSSLKRGAQDPAWFCDRVLGTSPWAKQIEILESVRDNKETGVKSCNGAGKTKIASWVVLWFGSCYPGSVIVTTAPTARQVRALLWAEIRQGFNSSKYRLPGTMFKTQWEIRDDPKWYAKGFTAENPTTMHGFHADHVLVVVDEADGINKEIFDEGIAAILTNDHCRLLMIGNPTNPTSQFAEKFKQEDVNKITISAFDTPNFTHFGITLDDIRNDTWRRKITGPLPRSYLVTPEWVAGRFKVWGEASPMFQARVLGQFPEMGSNVLIPFSWVERAQARW